MMTATRFWETRYEEQGIAFVTAQVKDLSATADQLAELLQSLTQPGIVINLQGVVKISKAFVTTLCTCAELCDGRIVLCGMAPLIAIQCSQFDCEELLKFVIDEQVARDSFIKPDFWTEELI